MIAALKARGHEVTNLDRAVPGGIEKPGFAEENLISGDRAVRAFHPQYRGGIALRVEVDDEDAFAFGGERCREVDGGGGFADAAFLVGNGEDLCAHVFAAVGWINGGILTFFA